MFTSGSGRRYGCNRDGDHRQEYRRGELESSDGRGFGRGRQLERFFSHGNLHFIVLYLIAEKPRSCYEIIKAIEEMVDGACSPSPGSVYPVLAMLEDQGYVIAGVSEGNKKHYSVTEEGKSYLDANNAAVEALKGRIKQAGVAQRGFHPHHVPRPHQITRIVENLKLALRLRLEGQHGNADGNVVRAAVLGANDGLVSNLSLVMGMMGAAANQHTVLIAGLAGLIAGACAMAVA